MRYLSAVCFLAILVFADTSSRNCTTELCLLLQS